MRRPSRRIARKASDGEGGHDWNALKSRCKADSLPKADGVTYRVVEVREDPVTGVRQVTVRRSANQTGKPAIAGRFQKTVYRKSMTPEGVDAVGEQAFQKQSTPGTTTEFVPYGRILNGRIVNGRFKASVPGPKGDIQVEGYFREDPNGVPEIVTHFPSYGSKPGWPAIKKKRW